MVKVKDAPVPLDLCAYGKLALSPEYFKVRCYQGAPGAYREWIDQGFDWAGRTMRQEPAVLRGTWLLLFYPEGHKRAVVATVRQSADQGGARAFPFTAFTTIERRHLAERASAQVRQLAPTWVTLQRRGHEIAGLDSIAECRATIDKIELPPFAIDQAPEPDAHDGLAGFARAVGGDGDPPGALATMLWDIRNAYRAIASGRIPGHRLPGLRLPLAPGIDAMAQAIAWLQCLESSGFLVVRPKTPVTIGFPAVPHEASALWIVRRPPRAQDFMMMTSGPLGYLYPEPEEHREELAGRAVFLQRARHALSHQPLKLDALGRLSLENLT